MPLIRKPEGNTPKKQEEMSPPALSLRSPDADERWAAARAVSDLPQLAAALLAETAPRVRTAILTALARLATPAAAEAVLPLLRDDDAQVRAAALDALRAMPQALRAKLPDLLADPDPDVRLLSCEIARSLGTDAAPLLAARLGAETQANVCAAAIDVLAETGGPEVLPALASCVARFPADPFLAFAVRVAAQRIGEPRG